MKNQKENELFYQIALTQAELIGPKRGRVLLSHFRTAEAVFKAGQKDLVGLAHFGRETVKNFQKNIDFKKIEEEIKFIQNNDIQVLTMIDPSYPKRLLQCPDAPLLLYYKGNANLNHPRIVSIVGNRLNSDYGLRCAENLVQGLASAGVMVVSGLAAGIDGIAHQSAIANGVPTIGVVAHGLDMLYPAQHKNLSLEMQKNGGLLTEFPSKSIPDKQNFPLRNRIVAGLSDITVVVETNVKGGSMITAKLATGYNREVAAFPGKIIDQKSRGCNYLIKTQMAHLIENATDLLEIMNWQPDQKNAIQKKLFKGFSTEEMNLIKILEHSEGMHIDEISIKSKIQSSKLASILLSLEMENTLKALPGKRYRLQ